VSWFFLLSGKVTPIFLVDADGEPAWLPTLEEAREAALRTPMCMALGYVIIEWNEHGFMEANE
jgi:hypothetical protein